MLDSKLLREKAGTTRLRPVLLVAVILCVTVSIVVFLRATPLKGSSPPRTYEPFPDSQEFNDARQLLGDSLYEDALKKFQGIVQRNPGTTLAAESQIQVAQIHGGLGNHSLMFQEYQDIITRYPGSRFEIGARSSIIDITTRDFPDYLQKSDELATSFGGPSVTEALKARESETVRAKIRMLHPEFRAGLAGVYGGVASRLYGLQRYDESIQLSLLCRENFPKSTIATSFLERIQSAILNRAGKRNAPDYPEDTTPPKIRPIAPRDNQIVGDATPKIEILLDDGDIAQGQVILQTLEFRLNDRDLTNDMDVRIEINPSAQFGPQHVFERIHITYRPESPLPPGQYAVFVKAEDYGARTSIKSWSFTVR